MVTTRLFTRLAAGLAACAISLGLAATPAASDSVIRTQKYVDLLGLKKLHAEGWTGEGITIGLVDGRVDDTVPELKGAKIEHKEYCNTLDYYTPNNYAHATSVASVLVSPYYGWAPKATLINYGFPIGADERVSIPQTCKDKTSMGRMLNRMLNDRVDIAVFTVGSDLGVDMVFAYGLVRAADLGIPVVISAGNSGRSIHVMGDARYNGTIAVGAVDLNGKVTEFTDRGKGLTLMAPGTNITTRSPGNGRQLTRILSNQEGTSLSAPMVGGALALAKQKWPDAHGNQLVHSLIGTATRKRNDWSPTYGWGLLNVWGLIDEDPTTLPTNNPLLQKKKDDTPNPEMIADFRDGLLDEHMVAENNDYIYRGNNKTAAKRFPPERRKMGTSPRYASLKDTPAPTTSPTPGATSTSADPADNTPNSDGNGPLLWVLVGLGILGAAVTITAVVIMRRRHHTAQ